ncbi:MAG TPA: hypothetical protein VKF60_08195 [Myxococcota bacterium]|nr:hypothetical protein [Myxococcota bacterium]
MTTARSRRAALCLLLAGLCASAARGGDLGRSSVPVRLAGVKKIGIMPIEAAITRLQFPRADAPAVEEQEAAVADVRDMELKILSAREFNPTLVPLTEKLFTDKPELRFQVTQVQKNAQTAMTMLRTADQTGAEAVIRGSFDELQQLGALSGADALLFTRVDGWLRTGFGRILFRSRSSTTVAICLIDANTGQVLFVDSSTRSIDPLWRVTELALEGFRR